MQHHPRRRTLDHVIPKSVGGHHKGRNIVPACYACNQLKHSMLLDEFRVLVGGSVDHQFWGEQLKEEPPNWVVELDK